MHNQNNSHTLCIHDVVHCDTGIPSGGTSQSKLLGAFKLHVNGRVVGMGPGRRINQTQGVDAIDVTGVVTPGENTIAIQGYHTGEKTTRPQLPSCTQPIWQTRAAC
jgi:hypothetical protein